MADAPAMAPLTADVQVTVVISAPMVPSVRTGLRVQSVHYPVNLNSVGVEAVFFVKNK
jgi:hypothetical protein